MVPRLDADALVDAVALRLPAGRVPLRAARRGERRAAASADDEFDLLDTGVFDERPVLGHHRRLREGHARGHVHPPARPQRRPGRGHAPRAADDLVPEPVVVEGGRPQAGHPPRRRHARRHPPRARRTAPGRERRARAAVLRERDEQRAAVRRPTNASPYPKDGINDHVVTAAPHREPGPPRHQGRAALRR